MSKLGIGSTGPEKQYFKKNGFNSLKNGAITLFKDFRTALLHFRAQVLKLVTMFSRQLSLSRTLLCYNSSLGSLRVLFRQEHEKKGQS